MIRAHAVAARSSNSVVVAVKVSVERNPGTEIRVVAAAIFHHGQLFLAQRPAGSSQGGLWEIPGGKVEAGETDQQALQRELTEELAIDVVVGDYIAESVTDYGDKVVRLVAYRAECDANAIEQIALHSHQASAWVSVAGALTYPLCPADIPLLEALLA
uniref:(deoxy)nucleoside triphosphate pyrophosphohydrolase n=1 Tax=Thaumasiovibrio occultus TaxID=1891184 RepID=UPI000B34DA88|nr:(deoxy)nucleoside triphosphate pyrophosphohydrolase [Thaumasiovibrio occultus]